MAGSVVREGTRVEKATGTTTRGEDEIEERARWRDGRNTFLRRPCGGVLRREDWTHGRRQTDVDAGGEDALERETAEVRCAAFGAAAACVWMCGCGCVCVCVCVFATGSGPARRCGFAAITKLQRPVEGVTRGQVRRLP